MADLLVYKAGLLDYEPVWRAMSDYTDLRQADSPDQLWILEHTPVYTQGQAGKPEHLLAPSKEIPIVQTDRGGQVTYHGPGQMVAYPLIDLRRQGLGVRDMVTLLEHSVIKLCQHYGLSAQAKKDAPGVYIAGSKIASLGLRVRKGCCFHGLSLNVSMDLAPFNAINPCGYPGLNMCQLSEFVDVEVSEVIQQWSDIFLRSLKYETIETFNHSPLKNGKSL